MEIYKGLIRMRRGINRQGSVVLGHGDRIERPSRVFAG